MRTLAIRILALLGVALATLAHGATPMVSSSSSHSLALKSDGTVVAWGSDRYGALGTGRSLSSNVGVKIQGLPRIVSYAVYDDAIAAVDGQGQVWTWGPGVSMLGPRESALRAIPARIVGLSNVVQVAIGWGNGVAVRRDGTVVCWAGCPTASTPIPGAAGLSTINGLADIVEVAVGQSQLLALRRDGAVLSMGANTYGDVGDGTKLPRNAPYLIPELSGIVSVAAALAHSVALRSDGKVFYWGGGYTSIPPVNSPVELTGLGGPAIAIGADPNINLAIRADGTVWLWDAARALYQEPGYTNSRALGSSDGAGYFFNSNLAVVASDGKVRVVGYNPEGQLGDGSSSPYSDTPVVVSNVSGAVAVQGFRNGFVALTSQGELWAWGANGNILGAGMELDRARPFPVAGVSDIVAVAAGQDTSYALRSDGRVYAWGSNISGKLGREGASSATPALVPALTNVSRVAAGAYHALFVKSDTSLWTVGSFPASCITACPVRNQFGIAVTGIKTTDKAIAAGHDTSYAITTGGTVIAWGAGALGQRGQGNRADSPYPLAVSLPGSAVQVATLRASVLALIVSSGTNVYGWGDNIGNVVGPGPFQVLNPQLISGFLDAITISSGFYHSLALRSDGVVLAMGNNSRGELGDGTTSQRAVPVPVLDIGGELVTSLSAGEARSFAVRSDGLVYAWGAPNGSGYGNLADGTFVTRTRAVVAISEKDDANLDDTACNQSLTDRFWYLDLEPTNCFVVPSAKVPKLFPVATYSTGTNLATSIGTEIAYRRADFGSVKKTYVLGAVPPEFLDAVPLAKGQAEAVAKAKAGAAKAGGLVIVQLTAAGWSVVSGQITAYFTGITDAERRSIKLLEAVPAAKIPGASFCVGYGDSVDQMLASQQMRVVATVPGTSLSVTLPCLISGTYINGPESSLQGQNVTFNASVVGEGPTGTVQFKDGAANLGAAVTATAASASIATAARSTASLTPGDHAITAVYSGNTNVVNPPSTSGALAHRVLATKSGTSTTLAVPARSLLGMSATFLASVAGAAPSGAVTFRDGGVAIATVNLSGGVARFEAKSLGLGTHSITADYAGDAGNLASTAAAAPVLVYSAATEATVMLQGPAASISVGATAVFTVSVAATSATGVVDLYDRTTVIASATLSGGNATLNASFATSGLRFVYAYFRGNGTSLGAYSGNVAVSVTGSDPNADSDGDGINNATEEAEGRNPLVRDNDVFGNARLFAMQQYRDFLGREGDAGGITYWSGQVATGARTRAQGVENFFLSPEFQNTIAPVVRLYFAYFIRIPDYGGLDHWIRTFKSGTSMDSISNSFALSAEFTNRYGALSNAQFVDLVYRNVLGRAPEPGGFGFWTQQLESGARTRGQVMLNFSESEEYRGVIASEVYVTMMYAGMLRREAEAAGFAFWVGYLDQGNSGLALIDGFLGAQEYRNRFLP